MTNDLYRTLLVMIGFATGGLTFDLLNKTVPSFMAWKDIGHPTLQGALVGGVIVLLFAVAAMMIAEGPQ